MRNIYKTALKQFLVIVAMLIGISGIASAADDSTTIPMNVMVNVDVLANDSGNPTGVTAIDGNAVNSGDIVVVSHGKVRVNANGTVDYLPNLGFSGSDSFGYTNDNGDSATVSVTVQLRDTDGDGDTDDVDTDDDGNGIPDAKEILGQDGTCLSGLFYHYKDSGPKLTIFDPDKMSQHIIIGRTDSVHYNALVRSGDSFYAVAKSNGNGADGTYIAKKQKVKINPLTNDVILYDTTKVDSVSGGGENGIMYYFWGTVDSKYIKRFDIAAKSAMSDLVYSAKLPTRDIAILNGIAYGVDNTKLYRISLDENNVVFTSHTVSGLSGSADFGAAMLATNAFGEKELYVIRKNSGVYRIDNYVSGNPTAVLISASGGKAYDDGIGCPNANVAGADTDGDGIPDYKDIDSDNDGVIDTVEIGSDPNNPLDTDGDGIPNYLDIDSDNDGIVDIIEAQSTSGYTAPTGLDSDYDGLDDAYDNASSSGLTPEDTDSDGTPDYLDTDSDNEGGNDALEGWDANHDGTADVTPSGNDVDHDGLDDAYDNDTSAFNPTNSQTPSSFPDQDGDGERDWRDDSNNPPASSSVPDIDNDGVMDDVDIDDDNDGITDVNEMHDVPSVANINSSGNGQYPDQLYLFNLTDPSFNDGINVNDQQTFHLPGDLNVTIEVTDVQGPGSNYKPVDINTGSGSGVHTLYDTNGTKEAVITDVTGQGEVTIEFTFTAVKNGKNYPLDLLAIDGESTGDQPNESLKFVTDGGTWKLLEQKGNGGTFSGAGTKTLTDTGTDASNTAIYYSEYATKLTVTLHPDANGKQAVVLGMRLIPDDDNDGVANRVDIDADNDGIPDNVEAQLTNNYQGPGATFNDSDNDGLNDNYDDASNSGLTPVDTDEDGLNQPDFIDLDSDNDGITDCEEGIPDNTPNKDCNVLPSQVGNNGLVSWAEDTDDYTDVNGKVDDPTNALHDETSTVGDRGYREIKCGKASIDLEPLHWIVVSAPCDTHDANISDLFGGSLGAYGDKNNDGTGGHWLMFKQISYTGHNNIDMQVMEANETMEIGKGYWLIVDDSQADANGIVHMQLNENAPGINGITPAVDKSTYSVGAGDNEFDKVINNPIALPDSNSSRKVKVMLGNPFVRHMHSTRIYYDSDAVGSYKTLPDTTVGNYVEQVLYKHNSPDRQAGRQGDSVANDGEYIPVDATTPGIDKKLSPMDGYWMLLKPGSATDNKVIVPFEKKY